MANMDGDIEIVDNTVEEVLPDIARNSRIEVGNEEIQMKTSEKRGADESIKERMSTSEKRGVGESLKERMSVMEKELMKIKGEVSERRAENEATKWEVEDVSSRVVHMSDWARTQFRSADTYIGRARRVTFDCR